MPYEEVEVECDLHICIQNSKGFCIAAEPVDSLHPSSVNCFKFRLPLDNTTLLTGKRITNLLEYIEKYNVPYLSLDDQSNMFRIVKLDKNLRGIVRGDDILGLRFSKAIDGGIHYVHEDQLELAL